MDVVCPVGKAHDSGELRYALRSLCFLEDVGSVTVVGARPPWFTGRYIPSPQRSGAYANTTNAMLAALGDDGISDPFLWTNDDIFALRPGASAEWTLGPISAYLAGLHRAVMRRESAAGALRLLREHGIAEPLNFEAHIPLPVHKDAMLRAIREMRGRALPEAFKRSIYGNLAGLDWPARTDVKIRDTAAPPFWDDWVSTTRQSFAGATGKRLRRLLPEPSDWET